KLLTGDLIHLRYYLLIWLGGCEVTARPETRLRTIFHGGSYSS
ncbi:hypothetical protein THAOC_21124, partial [Thalassiosira oceanica]